jgi:NADH-ubiquinone oxidoreductase chain 5
MEGPTPVSALIHAATMVTAGVFLLIRCSPLFEYATNILNFIILIGSITALFGATTATTQNDLKKIIAYSTTSQLGFMFISCGLSEYFLSFFHLFNHAFFKALLFLTAGVIIHKLSGEQDIRKMGSLTRILPLTYIAILIGSLSLMGLPFFSGFYSKHAIIELAFLDFKINNFFLISSINLSSICTIIYSIRLISIVFFET